jgi:RNA polymerase sigma-70 factor (ECF subfamily)
VFTVTSDTLLAGLQDPGNAEVWHGYVERYRPMLVRWLQRCGVPAADAEDLAQDVLLAFATALREGKYAKERGRLRAWLFGIAQMLLRNRLRRQRGAAFDHGVGGSTDQLADIADPDDGELRQRWEEEWRDAVLRQCLEEVRREVEPATFEAFVLFARQGLAAREVAGRLQMSENAVFGAKRRVLQRLRELQPAVEAIW